MSMSFHFLNDLLQVLVHSLYQHAAEFSNLQISPFQEPVTFCTGKKTCGAPCMLVVFQRRSPLETTLGAFQAEMKRRDQPCCMPIVI